MPPNLQRVRERLLSVPVAHLATVGPQAQPHLIPITFALLGDDRLVSAVDHKPKRTTALRRLANIVANPQVCILADHYDDDWTRLWWLRCDGRARVLEPGEAAGAGLRTVALDALQERYAQYRRQLPTGAVIVVDIDRWTTWSAGADPDRTP